MMTIDTGSELGCGKTLDELADYLARDRIPYDPVIESCPECRNALRSLERVSQLSHDLFLEEAAALPPPPAGWFDAIMTSIRTEMRSGRDLPLAHPDPRVRLTVTEGAVRSLIRSAGDAIPGLIVGSVRLEGPAEIPHAPVTVVVTASVAWQVPIPPLADRLRTTVLSALHEHTELEVTAIDIRIEELHGLDPTGAR